MSSVRDLRMKGIMSEKNYIDKLRMILTKEELQVFYKDRESLINFGCEYLEIGEYRKAFHIFIICFRLNGCDIDVLNGMGVSLCELGRLRTSRSVLEKTAELFPDDAITLANLAGVYWEESDFDNAIYYYNKSLVNDPNIQETHFNIINLYYEKGDLFMAYISCINFLKKYPSNDQAKEIRDNILLDMGISFI